MTTGQKLAVFLTTSCLLPGLFTDLHILCVLTTSLSPSREKVSSKKTHEELQLEEMKRLQTLTRKRLRASRRSFVRLSKTSGPVQVKGKLPTTETVEFHFHQTSREKKGTVMYIHCTVHNAGFNLWALKAV